MSHPHPHTHRMHPLSISTAWKRDPMALDTNAAATVESTPPLTAPITWF